MTAPLLNAAIQGQGTISADNLNTYIQNCTNIALLRSFIGLPGMCVFIDGSVTPGDGGAGPFYWNTTSTGPDNDLTVIVPQPGVPGAWVRLIISQTSIVTLSNIASVLAFDGGASVPVIYVEGYYTLNDGGEGIFVFNPSDTTSTSNGGTIIIDASNNRYYRETNGQPYSVKWFGATGNNTGDDAPSIRNTIAAAQDGTGIFFPSGTYLLNSTQTSPISDLDPPNILVEGKSNFAITGEPGAILTSSDTANYSEHFLFNNCTNFLVSGLTHYGNQTGFVVSQENGAYGINSCVNFTFRDLHMTGPWGGNGAMFVGDWLFNGLFENILGDKIGIGFDLAFMQNCTFRSCFATGNEGVGTTGTGNKFFSNIYDIPSLGNNLTGLSLNNGDTNNILIEGCGATNFNTGIFLSSGKDIQIIGGFYYLNPGIAASSVGGIGAYIDYLTGTFSSSGFPVQRVNFIGVEFWGNGSSYPGAGILIDGSSITNSDLISDISIRSCFFYNNANTGISGLGTSHLNDITIVGCSFEGAVETTPISASLYQGIVSATNPFGANITSNPGFNPQKFAITTPSLPGGTGFGNTVENNFSFPVEVYIATNAAAYQAVIQDPSNTFNTGTVSASSGPLCFTLQPGMNVFFNTAVPTIWKWSGA